MRDRLQPLAPLFGLVVYFWSHPAWAAGGGGGGDLEFLLLLVGIVGLAYLVAHLLLERVARRFGIVTGVEYIVLGAIIFQFIIAPLFPAESGATALEKTRQILEQLRPILVLGTGSVGLLLGSYLDFRHRDPPSTSALRTGAIMSLTTLTTVVALPAAAIWYVYSASLVSQITPVLLCVGAIALVAGDAPIRSMVSFLGAEGSAPRIATDASRMCSSFAIVVFGLLFCLDNSGPFVMQGQYAWIEWLAIHLVLGGALGLVFSVFIQQDLPDDQLLTVVIGMVVFTSGIAYELELSPIFFNFLTGVVFFNTCQYGGDVRSRLESIKHPLYIVLFLFTGAYLDLSVTLWAYALAVPYLFVRMAGRWLGDLFSNALPGREGMVPHLGRALIAPGGLSAAMALDFLTVYNNRYGVDAGPFLSASQDDVAIIYAGLVAAIVISEIVAYLMIRQWLIDTADVSSNRIRRDTLDAPSEDLT